MKSKLRTIVIAAGACTLLAAVCSAQQPSARTAPPAPATPPYSASGRIQQLNYGPDGAVNGFLLDDGTLAHFPPFSAADTSSLRPGTAVNVTGYTRPGVSGRSVVELRTVSLKGRTVTFAATGPRPPTPAAPPQPPPARPVLRPAPPPPPPPPAGDRVNEPTPPPPPAAPQQP